MSNKSYPKRKKVTSWTRWTPEEDRIVAESYSNLGGELRIAGRTLSAIRRRATVLGVCREPRWTRTEEDILIKYYPLEGPLGVSKRINRKPNAIKIHATGLNIRCAVHSDGDKVWTDEEINIVKLRYPSEGAVQLSKDLDRSIIAVRACARNHNVKVDRGKYKMFSEGRTGANAGTFRGHGKIFKTYVSSISNRGWACTVDAKYLDSITTEYCPLSGLPLKYKRFSGDTEANASIDRIDSSKGYIKGNVQWVDKKVNIMKSNMTEKELLILVRAIANTLSAKIDL